MKEIENIKKKEEKKVECEVKETETEKEEKKEGSKGKEIKKEEKEKGKTSTKKKEKKEDREVKEEKRGHFTKKNIILTGIISICMVLILITAVGLIFPDNNLKGLDKKASEDVIKSFIEEVNKEKDQDYQKYMIEGWENKDIKPLFIGGHELEKVELIQLKNDKYVQYISGYIEKKKRAGVDIAGKKYTSYTATINHVYKQGSKYKNEEKEIVFLMEKEKEGWKIITFATKGIIDSLIK